RTRPTMSAQNRVFYHPLRLDTRILQGTPIQQAALQTRPEFAKSIRLLPIDPSIFTQAYLLLGNEPLRFTSDLSLYLSTVRTFFERVPAETGICIPGGANPDARRRLSEDLGVACAAFFMVSA